MALVVVVALGGVLLLFVLSVLFFHLSSASVFNVWDLASGSTGLGPTSHSVNSVVDYTCSKTIDTLPFVHMLANKRECS